MIPLYEMVEGKEDLARYPSGNSGSHFIGGEMDFGAFGHVGYSLILYFCDESFDFLNKYG